MMKELSLEVINQSAPYTVLYVALTDDFMFRTDAGVELAIAFIEDDLIRSGESYQLVISNVNNKQSPMDKKVRQTIFTIVQEFFEKNEAALLYICSTGDGRQLVRYRLFTHWYDRFEYAVKYTCLTTVMTDMNGIPNAATVFVRNDNPKLAELMSGFNRTATILRQKPAEE